MKKWILALTLAGGVLALSACNQSGSETIAQSKAGDVTQEELYNAMKEKVGDKALQQLIYEKVLSKKYKVSDKDVNDKIKQLKADLGSNFEAALAQYGYQSENDLKSTLKLGMLQEKAAMKDIKVTEKELKDYYNNYKTDIKVRHILVKDLKTAKDVENQLKSGKKFEDVAKKESTDTVSAKEGGDLGIINNQNAGQFDKDFIKAAYALKVNEISAPVKTQFGYHIIQVTEKKEKKPYNEMKQQIEYEVKSSKLTNDDINKAMEREMKAANVKITDKDLKDALKTQTTTAGQ
ncbi:peptidylprolyl isomerase [Neobacillus sp. OS1-32]|jgi:foldase protein PrsA|uniref:Foldase protein PrsA n=1 Tax=Neobacillus paridis TaxID=2803862 RepID=A0ABS1TUX1_9BACI|nr:MULTISPECIES: peptidylprolyl isomerase [Neobacillus]MBL4955102.1 peptidylprolyl isomerase [Neobacillus paridis]WML32141.1 peptidylprolyl isomerase [Neobacillus sp. OS1-32]